MKFLATPIPEIETANELETLIQNEENVMVCCGRMGPMCIPVYDAMSTLEKEYDHVAFRSMAFDSPEAAIIRNLPECRGFMGLPFTVYYKGGKVVHATSSIQSKDMVTDILDSKFTK
jgi:thioredoxin 1